MELGNWNKVMPIDGYKEKDKYLGLPRVQRKEGIPSSHLSLQYPYASKGLVEVTRIEC